MISIKKRIMAVVAAVTMMSSSALSVGACGCSNSNTHNADDVCHYSYEIKGTNRYSSKMTKLGDVSKKKTDTSVYFYCFATKNEKIKMQVAVCGIKNPNSSNKTYNNVTLNSRGSRVEWVECSAYVQYEIYNRVNEDGYTHCDLKVDHNGEKDSKYIYSFCWSPDTCNNWGGPYVIASSYQPLQ